MKKSKYPINIYELLINICVKVLLLEIYKLCRKKKCKIKIILKTNSFIYHYPHHTENRNMFSEDKITNASV